MLLAPHLLILDKVVMRGAWTFLSFRTKRKRKRLNLLVQSVRRLIVECCSQLSNETQQSLFLRLGPLKSRPCAANGGTKAKNEDVEINVNSICISTVLLCISGPILDELCVIFCSHL